MNMDSRIAEHVLYCKKMKLCTSFIVHGEFESYDWKDYYY